MPIECATFLLNEKRSVIEQIENRLKVGIIILPSKHLETPAYDIERIKEKETADEKPSYLQIKAEEITIPEFAQQSKSPTERAAVREFLHDSPAPAQNKNEAATLIKRFWNKLVNCANGIESEPSEPVLEIDTLAPVAVAVVEKVPATQEGQSNRNRNRRNNNKNKTPQEQKVPQEPAAQNQEPRPNRPARGPGRNVRPNLAPVSLVAETEANNETVVVLSQPITEAFDEVPNINTEVTGVGEELTPKPERKNNTRRGPNRRRPRNPNYKKPETEGDAVQHHDDPVINEDESRFATPTPRSYDREFAERIEKVERAEPVNEPKPVEQQAAPVVEFTSPVEVNKPDSSSES